MVSVGRVVDDRSALHVPGNYLSRAPDTPLGCHDEYGQMVGPALGVVDNEEQEHSVAEVAMRFRVVESLRYWVAAGPMTDC